MTSLSLLGLLGAGIAAGLVGTVASLASVVSYPALLAFGLSPVSANVTNTVALMFSAVGAAAGSRPELAGQGRRVLRLGAVTAAGGAVGAALLLLTPARGFEYAAPVLIAVGSVIIMRPAGRPAETAVLAPATLAPSAGLAPVVVGGLMEEPARPERGLERDWASWGSLVAASVYIGYFGAAGGILLLAVLIRMLAQPLARVNAVKNAVAGLANAVAGLGFAVFGPVRWAAVLPLAAGFLIGGWTGPKLVRRLPAGRLRIFVGCCGLAAAVKLGASAYL